MVAKKLRELRKKAGLTLIDVAEVVGVSESQISRYEGGSRRPRLDEAHKLAQLYGVPIWELFPNLAGAATSTLKDDLQEAFVRTLGSRLKFRRDQLGLTQTEVAKRISDLVAPRAKRFSQQAYNHLESGKSQNSSELPAVAEVLGVDLKWLRDGTGPAPEGPGHPPSNSSLAEQFHAATMKRLPEANQGSLRSDELLEVLRVILDVPATDRLSAEALYRRIVLAQRVIQQFRRL